MMKSQPFFFDANIFDDDTPLSEEERAKLPEFSREELEAAKLKAFEDGKREGLKESLDSIHNKTLGLLQKIENDLGMLFSAEEDRQKEYEKNATLLAAEIFTKSFPTYMEAHGLTELREAVVNALSSHMIPENIQIEINDAVFAPFTELIKEYTNNLQKQITFKADATLSEHACRVSWAGGGLICDRNALSEKIFNILNHSLAEHGFSLHDMEDSKEHNIDSEIISGKVDDSDKVGGTAGVAVEREFAVGEKEAIVGGEAGVAVLGDKNTQDLPDQVSPIEETTTSGEA